MYRLLATTVLAGVGWLLPHPALAQVLLTAPTPGAMTQPGGVLDQFTTTVPSTLQVTIQEGHSATVQVAAPTLVSGPSPDPNGTTRTATVNFAGNSVTSGDAAVALPTGTTTLNVSMAVTRPTIYSPGTYVYQVEITVTATPN